MSIWRRFFALGVIVCAALAGAVACGREKRANVAEDHPLVTALTAGAEALQRAGGGRGFVCTGGGSGDITVCVCDDNAPSGSIYSCEGMERICDLLGTGSLCNPSTDWCWCGG
jgi:hypothetical protein